MIRVVVVEDSPVARNLLIEILGAEADFEVVGVAINGVEAVEKVCEMKPDVVTMDVQMPRMDGYAATREIMITCPTPIVVVSGSTGESDVQKSMESLAAGALSVIGKPASPASPDFERTAKLLVDTVRSMAAVKVIRQYRSREQAPASTPSPPRRSAVAVHAKARLITIAASTGGPKALRQVLGDLPKDFPIPIVIVQHISQGFTDGLAQWLNSTVDIDIKIAKSGEQLHGGCVYIAPENSHCSVRSNPVLELTDDDPVGGFRPSATVIFESAAEAYGQSHIAVILTGMGRDGVDGLRVVRKTKGLVIAQDEESCVVFGMPKAAIDEGLVDAVLPLHEIGPQLVAIVQSRTSDAR